MLDLIIIGAGGFGCELHALLWDVFASDTHRFKGFLADQTNPRATRLGPILASPDAYQPTATDRFLLAIGDIEARRRTSQSLAQRGGQFASYTHPTAMIARTATIGQGAVIYPYATVSNEAQLDDHVHLNYYASVGHDAKVGRYCLLAPYATLNGFCVLEEDVYVSTHATVVVGQRVGARSKISANSAVMRDVPTDSMVFGVPGRVTKRMVKPRSMPP